MGSGAPPDDDPATDWQARENDDTEVVLLASELLDFAAEEERTPALPGFETGVLAGIELGEHRGAARVLHAVRDQVLADGALPGVADAIVQALADAAGVKLG